MIPILTLGRFARHGTADVTWDWTVRCISEERVSNFLDPDRPALAIFSSAAVGGCSREALRRGFTILLRHWGDAPFFYRVLALHFGTAEPRYCGPLWIEVAASMGIEMNDVVEEDGFTRLVRRRWELAERDGMLVGLEKGREEGREATLRAAQVVLAPDDFARLRRALDEMDTGAVDRSSHDAT
ncbi:MAG: hypothetical protein ACI81R_003083 [Bradymonadia bacterium]